MKALSDMGFKQAVLPPQERPHLPLLRQLGFSGSDQQVLAAVAKHSPTFITSQFCFIDVDCQCCHHVAFS